jgi:hypothetical protein
VRFALVDRAGGPQAPEWNLELTVILGRLHLFSYIYMIMLPSARSLRCSSVV